MPYYTEIKLNVHSGLNLCFFKGLSKGNRAKRQGERNYGIQIFKQEKVCAEIHMQFA